jgi:hypothetical protein
MPLYHAAWRTSYVLSKESGREVTSVTASLAYEPYC